MVDFSAFENSVRRLTDEDISDLPFCQGKTGYEWTASTAPRIVNISSSGDYENSIRGFIGFGAAAKAAGHNNVLVIIGGAGEGKSTTVEWSLRSALRTQRICTRTEQPCLIDRPIISLDFRRFDKTYFDEAALDQFWRHVVGEIGRSSELQSSFEFDGYVRFLSWCSTKNEIVCQSEVLQNFLGANRDAIQCYLTGKAHFTYSGDSLLGYLDIKRQGLFHDMRAEDRAWHDLLRLGYVWSKGEGKCSCPLFLLDNLDHLPPKLQCEAVDTGILLASVLEAKVIIAIRPLTWEHALHGQFLVEKKVHFSPDIVEVVQSRLQSIRDASHDDFVRQCIERIETLLQNPGTKLGEMVRCTSGLSVRFALRNVYNMLESPILRRYLATTSGSEGMTVSDIARAYFFGESSTIVSHAFDNLYSVGRHQTTNSLLIKTRILHYVGIIREGTASHGDILKFCSKFGYDMGDVKQAIGELMISTRPLLWYSDEWDPEIDKVHARVLITPIGLQYFETLFGEPYYLHVCLAKGRDGPPKLDDSIEFDKKLTDVDLEEVTRFVKKYGSDQYVRNYEGVTCLALKHSRKLVAGLGTMFRHRAGTVAFDPKREHYITEKLALIINPAKT